jgi:hypothetical protein
MAARMAVVGEIRMGFCEMPQYGITVTGLLACCATETVISVAYILIAMVLAEIKLFIVNVIFRQTQFEEFLLERLHHG